MASAQPHKFLATTREEHIDHCPARNPQGTMCPHFETAVSPGQDDQMISLTFHVDDWRVIYEALFMAQRELLETVETAAQPIGPGLRALMERAISRTCDLKEIIETRIAG